MTAIKEQERTPTLRLWTRRWYGPSVEHRGLREQSRRTHKVGCSGGFLDDAQSPWTIGQDIQLREQAPLHKLVLGF